MSQHKNRCLWQSQNSVKPVNAAAAAAAAAASFSSSSCKDNPDPPGAPGWNDKEEEESYDEILRRFAFRPPTRTFFELCSNALVVGQEFAVSCFFLARHRLELLRYQTSQQQLQNNEQQIQEQIERTNNTHAEWASLENLSSMAVWITVLILLVYNLRTPGEGSENHHHRQGGGTRRRRTRQSRILTTDALLLAVLLRFLAGILRTLTASYSSDTVEALAAGLMILHWVACDYSYANGISCEDSKLQQPSRNNDNNKNNNFTKQLEQQQQQRPTFQGGTVSLNAAFFSTTLLVSRLESNVTAYQYVSLSIALFAFYPEIRHVLATHFPPSSSPALWLVTLSISTATLLLLIVLDRRCNDEMDYVVYNNNDSQTYSVLAKKPPLVATTAFVILLSSFCLVFPTWKFVLQRHKLLIRGPWDIPTLSTMVLDYSRHSNQKDSATAATAVPLLA